MDTLFPRGEKNEAFKEYFVGQSYLNMLTTTGVAIGNVTFGRGYYQEWGKPAQELKPGDVVNIPPEVKHWHGAAKDSWFCHLAIEVPAKDASNEWLEPVSDEDYLKLK